MAVRIARWVARVRREGEPGPEPARMMRGVGRVRRSRVVMSRGGDEVAWMFVAVEGCEGAQ